MIVAGGNGVGPCNGDSGGPLFVNSGIWNLIGIVSFEGVKNNCAVPNVPDGYTRVSSYCEWILQETVNATVLNGPTALCNNQSATYSITNTPYNLTAPVWSAGSGISINSSTGSATADGSYVGTSTITVMYSNNCSSASKTFNVEVGTQITGTYPRNGQTFQLYTSNQVNSGTTNSTVSAPGASSFTWSLVSTNAPGFQWGATAPTNSIMYMTLNSGQGATFDVSANTSCGYRTRRVSYYVLSGYRVAPNPAKESFAVVFDHADLLDVLPEAIELLSETSTKAVRSVNVKDTFNRKQFKDENKIVFDVRDLPRGTYYLKVTDKRNKEKPTETVRIILE